MVSHHQQVLSRVSGTIWTLSTMAHIASLRSSAGVLSCKQAPALSPIIERQRYPLGGQPNEMASFRISQSLHSSSSDLIPFSHGLALHERRPTSGSGPVIVNPLIQSCPFSTPSHPSKNSSTLWISSCSRPKAHNMTAVLGRTTLPNTTPGGAQYQSIAAASVSNTNPEYTSLASRIPSGSWDSHMHVVDPKRFPIKANALYTPKTHTLEDALSFEQSVGIDKIVLVQPSIYGTDNSCLLEALTTLGPDRARGIVVFDLERTPRATLDSWHQLGVRGVRVNYASVGRDVAVDNMRKILLQYADMIRPLGWVLQVYVPLEAMDALATIVPDLNIRLCIDHMGKPTLDTNDILDPYTLTGFRSLMTMLEDTNTFVKLSAPYRITRHSLDSVDSVAKEIIGRHGMTQVVFATDWPHTRFEGLDIRPWMEKVLDWSEDDQVLRERLFRGNAEDLWR